MSYVIVDVITQLQYRKPGYFYAASYESERGAKGACTKLNKKYGAARQLVVMSTVDYEAARPVPKMVKKVNLMSGKEYMESEDTPLCCSPSSETYWSL